MHQATLKVRGHENYMTKANLAELQEVEESSHSCWYHSSLVLRLLVGGEKKLFVYALISQNPGKSGNILLHLYNYDTITYTYC